MIRVVRTPEGRVEIDPTGKKNGRGAYVHESRSCWDEALKRDRLARALKVTIEADDFGRLKAHAEALAQDGNENA
jgi:predicted RNA-binding protein YlxR (DUF448 family)